MLWKMVIEAGLAWTVLDQAQRFPAHELAGFVEAEGQQDITGQRQTGVGNVFVAVQFAEAAQQHGQGWQADGAVQAVAHDPLTGLAVCMRVTIPASREEAGFQVAVDALVDRGDDRADLVGVRQAHGIRLAVHGLADSLVRDVGAASVDQTHGWCLSEELGRAVGTRWVRTTAADAGSLGLATW
jgi:hypothetical protein